MSYSVSMKSLPKPRLRGAVAKTIVAGLVLIGILAFVKYRQITAAIAASSQFAPPPDAVTTAKVTEADWQVVRDFVGSLEAVQGTTLSAEDPGRVTKIGFESGRTVSAGDLLVQIDTSVEEGDLRAAEGRLELARVNLRRAQNLRAKNATSEQAVNDAVAALKEAEGAAAAVKGNIARKTIVAPYNGRTGIRLVNVGQYVSAGSPLVPLYSVDNLYLNFSVPQQDLTRVALGQQVNFHVDLYPGEVFSAKITAIDPQVDMSTRNARVQATAENGPGKLRPGMFVRVDVISSETEKVMPVPASAIQYAPYGNSVFIVEQMKNPQGAEYTGVRQQFVKLGPARGDLIGVSSGLKPGEEVVTSGGFKLRPGGAVVVNNSVAPGNSLAPTPSDT